LGLQGTLGGGEQRLMPPTGSRAAEQGRRVVHACGVRCLPCLRGLPEGRGWYFFLVGDALGECCSAWCLEWGPRLCVRPTAPAALQSLNRQRLSCVGSGSAALLAVVRPAEGSLSCAWCGPWQQSSWGADCGGGVCTADCTTRAVYCTTRAVHCTTRAVYCTTWAVYCTTQAVYCTTQAVYCTTQAVYCTTQAVYEGLPFSAAQAVLWFTSGISTCCGRGQWGWVRRIVRLQVSLMWRPRVPDLGFCCSVHCPAPRGGALWAADVYFSAPAAEMQLLGAGAAAHVHQLFCRELEGMRPSWSIMLWHSIW
jgi:hypothetical protein